MRPGSKLYEDDVELQKELEAAALAAEKNQLGVEAGQVGTNLPGVTKVNFEPEAVTPPAREVIAPKTVQVPGRADEDLDMAYAAAQDREAKKRMAFERGARELVAGLTRTQAPGIISQPGDAVAKLMAKRKEMDARLQQDNAAKLNAKKFSFEQQEAARLAAEKKAQDERDFAYRQQHDEADLAQRAKSSAASLALAGAGLGLRQRADQREEERLAKGKDLPASEVAALSELPVAEKQVDDLVAAFQRLDMGGASGRAAGAVTDALNLQGTDAAEYRAAAQLAQQAAGKIVEGGKLAAGDELKYRKMMPQPGDSPEVVKQKAEGMKSFLRDLASRRARAFKESGYNVAPSLMPSDAPMAPPARQTATNPQTGEKVEWDGTQWVPVKGG